MEVHLSSDVQQRLLHSAARQGRAADDLVSEVLNQYLADEARLTAVTDGWSGEEALAAKAQIEEGFLQAERGELSTPEQARNEIEARKQDWRRQRSTQ